MTLAELNAAAREAAEASFLACCGSPRWAREMAACRPFASQEALFRVADEAWWALDERDWLHAFAAHPRIGERKAAPAQGAVAAAWSRQEQAGVAMDDDAVKAALAEGNRAYEERFGRVYIVCATGKSAEEMLAILRGRLANDPAAELRASAAEQAKITRIRLEKLLAGG